MPTQPSPAAAPAILRGIVGAVASFVIVLTVPRTAAAALPSPPDAYALIPSASRAPAPDFALTDLDGHKLTLSQYRGHIVLLDFWAVDCGGCKIEIPWYVAFDKTYRSRGLQLIGIDMYGESPALIRPFMAHSGMTYPVAVGTDAIGARFHVEEMPLTLLIDREGRIALSHAGIVDPGQFERAIQQLLP